MNHYVYKPALAGGRRIFLRGLGALLIILTSLFLFNGPAWSFETNQPSSVIDADEKNLPIISAPSPVQSEADSCLPLLNNVRYDMPSSAMDRDRQFAGKAAAIGLVFGLRFALGPKEVRSSQRTNRSVGFEIRQPRDHSSRQALAVAQYRDCKNREALKALSDWRWER